METSPLDDASLPTDKEGLEEEIAELQRRLDANRQKIQTLMAEEDTKKGIFHAAAIHEAKQTGMILSYQKELREVRPNRMA